jgi:hypothetical protein
VEEVSIREDGNGGAVSESSRQWFKGCALGCGGLVVLFVLMIFGMSVSMRTAFDDAHEDRQALEERFGDNEAFTPVVDGSVTAERVEAFLTVREALSAIHAEIGDVDEEMGSFENLADGEEPPLREALPAIFSLTKSMIGLPWVFGEIERTRNRALVDAGMGLGEYAYIYTAAFHDQLVAPTQEANLFGASAANSRVRANLRGMIERQLTAAESGESDDEALVSALTAELQALDEDDLRIPWQDGLPEQITASFTDFRGRLDSTYSAAAAEFELLNSSVEGGGLRIVMD